MKLTVRQRVLLACLAAGWSIAPFKTGFMLTKPGRKKPPNGFEWIEKRTIMALVDKGIVDPITYRRM